MRLANKVAIVTGAGGGFGEGIAQRFAREGAKVAVVDLRGDEAGRVARALGGAAVALQADVGAADDVRRVVEETTARLGTPDILVNNAGTTHRNKPILEVTEEEFDRMFRVNVKSIYLFVREVAPVMRDAGGGVILNVGSTTGIRPRPGLTWYNAAIRRHDYDLRTDAMGAARPFVSTVPPGFPDGSTVDADGYLWNAEFNAGRVVRYAPDRRVHRSIPARRSPPTRRAGGGADLRTLFVTSTSQAMSEEELGRDPFAGALFALDAGVPGIAEPRWAGLSRQAVP